MSANQSRFNNMRTNKKNIPNRKRHQITLIVLLFLITLCGFFIHDRDFIKTQLQLCKRFDIEAFLENPPDYDGNAVTVINRNIPLFTEEEIAQSKSINYSPLDELGRCGTALGLLGPETIPQEKRGMIGDVRPSGWQTVRYDDRIEDRYLYNRCHLIGYQLAGDNADPRNLITGTRYLNMSGMLPFENMVFAYISETANHVLYRVRPIFIEDNLLASGVLMEARSIEDQGRGISFCVYAHNVQPGVIINYKSGDSIADSQWNYSIPIEIAQETDTGFLPLSDTEMTDMVPSKVLSEPDNSMAVTYVLNTNTKRFHDPACPSVQETKEKNRKDFYGSREEAIEEGYIPCGRCKP